MSSSRQEKRSDNLIKVAYFASLAGMSMTLGFSYSLSRIRKSSTEGPDAALYGEGVALARKALLKGTIYAVCGCTLFAMVSYKLFFKNMIREFRDDKIRRDQSNKIDYKEIIKQYTNQ